MYISKNDLIKHLVVITGKNRNEFLPMKVKTMTDSYKSYVDIDERIY